MRSNLITMLDGIGLQDHLGSSSSRPSFGVDAALLDSTSALLYPVFYRGRNYGGGQDFANAPTFTAFAQQVLPAELALVPDVLVIPLSKRATTIVQAACARGVVDPDRVLLEFPHLSGGNGHRVRFYNRDRAALADRVSRWARQSDQLRRRPEIRPGSTHQRRSFMQCRTWPVRATVTILTRL